MPRSAASARAEVVFEVRSPGDRWPDIYAKVAEYLRAGVARVCVLDPQREAVTLYGADEPRRTLMAGQEFSRADFLPGFAGPVRRFFAQRPDERSSAGKNFDSSTPLPALYKW